MNAPAQPALSDRRPWHGELSFGLIDDRIVLSGRTWQEQGRAAPHSRGPMLARRWTDSDDIALLAQPKLNGLRATADRVNGLLLRGGEPISALPHVTNSLAALFDRHPGIALDGELYAHGMPLARIAGACRRSAASADGDAIAFHIFDLIAADAAEVRIAQIPPLVGGHESPLIPVATSLCRTRRDLDAHYVSCLDRGYEGQMIRLPASPYVRGRGAALLKRKPMQDRDDIIAHALRRSEAMS